MSRTSANLLMLLAGLLWGGGFIAQETAMDDIGPFLFMTARFSLAALAVLPFAIYEYRRSSAEFQPIGRREWIAMCGVGVIFFIAMSLQQVGLLTTTVTNAGLLTGLYVVLVPIILRLFFRENQPAIIWPSVFAALIGIWLLSGGELSAMTVGDWLIIIGAVFAALHVITLGKAATGFRRPVALATIQFVLSAVFSFAGFLAAQMMNLSFEPAFSAKAMFAASPEILYAGLLAGAAAFTLMAICQQFTSAADAAILLSSEALFAALGGALILGERLSALGYFGCLLVFGAIVTVSVASEENEQPIENR